MFTLTVTSDPAEMRVLSSSSITSGERGKGMKMEGERRRKESEGGRDSKQQ